MTWYEPLLATGQAILLLVGLTLIYRILFRAEERRPWARCIITRTRIWAYVSMFFLSGLWLVHQWVSLSGRGLILKVLYLLTAATLTVLLVEALSAFVYDYFLIQRRQASVPALFRDLARGIVYLILIGLFIWGVLHIDITPLLTTSAIVSIIIGLALQETLGNVFSGLALHLSRPFSLGDWIEVGNYEGKVERIDWRATSIRTLSGDFVVIPNSSLAKQDLRNYSSPTSHHARIVSVGAHYNHPPSLVTDTLLAAARSSAGVISDPPPKAWVTTYGDFSITYRLKFWLDDFSDHDDIESNVMRQIWYHFKRSGIVFPFPIREVYHHRSEEGTPDLLGDGAVLGTIDFFKPLTAEAMASLAQRLRHDLYPRGDIVFRQGDPGDRFYVVKSGLVEVAIRNDGGDLLFSTNLGPGSFFGEMSLLTGDPRSAAVRVLEDSVLLSLGKADLKDLLDRHPKLDELICDAIAARQALAQDRMTDMGLASSPEGGSENETRRRSNQLLGRLREFFSY
ncbi:MAG: mechanosensitive ion channel family protein [Armatimonadetes bacterium]|nr:mechanosensitive ion channel family protein [Armatimonadota bacterium]